MIQYALKCAEGHRFDSWFQSAEAYDKLAGAGMVSCAICGGGKVEKAVMTPRVATARAGALGAPGNPAEEAIAALRRKIEEEADYVGTEFAREARRIHSGEAEERAIYGEARPEEARKLLEEGVPVAPLPFMPARKAN